MWAYNVFMKSKILFTILVLAGIGFFFLNQSSTPSSTNKNTHKDAYLVNELFSEVAELLSEVDQHAYLLKTLLEKKIITNIEKSEYEKVLNSKLKELTILRNVKKETQNTTFQSEKTKILFLNYIEINEEIALSETNFLQNITENYEKYKGKFVNKIPALANILQKNSENYNKLDKAYSELKESLKTEK